MRLQFRLGSIFAAALLSVAATPVVAQKSAYTLRISMRDALPKLLGERGIDFIEFDGWRAIDALEQQRGADAGRPRIKLTALEEMLEAARKEEDGG